MEIDDDIFDLYLKYKDDEEGFVDAYVKLKYKDPEIKDGTNIEDSLIDMLTKSIDIRIVGKLIFLNKSALERKLRYRKLNRILGK